MSAKQKPAGKKRRKSARPLMCHAPRQPRPAKSAAELRKQANSGLDRMFSFLRGLGVGPNTLRRYRRFVRAAEAAREAEVVQHFRDELALAIQRREILSDYAEKVVAGAAIRSGGAK